MENIKENLRSLKTDEAFRCMTHRMENTERKCKCERNNNYEGNKETWNIE